MIFLLLTQVSSIPLPRQPSLTIQVKQLNDQLHEKALFISSQLHLFPPAMKTNDITTLTAVAIGVIVAVLIGTSSILLFIVIALRSCRQINNEWCIALIVFFIYSITDNHHIKNKR